MAMDGYHEDWRYGTTIYQGGGHPSRGTGLTSARQKARHLFSGCVHDDYGGVMITIKIISVRYYYSI